MMRTRFWLAGTAAVLILLSGCGREEPTPEPDYPNPLLAHVPAGTPYLLASGKPMPKALNERFREAFQPLLDEVRADLDAQFGAMADTDPETAARLRAALDRVLALAEDGSLKRAGLTRDDRVVVYGNGLLPVLRMSVSDPEAFRAYVTEIAGAAGAELPVASHGDVSYWRGEFGPVLVAAGLEDGLFSLGVGPIEGADALLVHLFDAPPPTETATAGLVDMVDHYGFTAHGTGYLDSVRLAELLVGEAGLLDDMGVLPAEFTPACRSEIREFAALAPRMVMGYDALEEKRMALRSVLELNDALAGEVAEWAAPVPGLAPSDDALMVLGFGLEGVKAAGSMQRWLRQAGQREFACSALNGADWAAAAGAINTGPLYMVGNPRGFVLRLDGLEIRDLQAGDVSVDGSVVMLLENAQTIPAMAKGFAPGLQDLDIPLDGTPVALPEQATEQLNHPAFAAMTDTLLGVAVGGNGESGLRAAMRAAPGDPPPVFHASLDAGWFYGLLAEWLPRVAEMAETEEGDAEGLEELERSAVMMQAYADLFDRLHYSIVFTGNGVEFAQEVILQ